MGKHNDKIHQHGHDTLSVFGIGVEYNQPQWRSILRQLVVLGLLSVDTDGFGALKLTETSRPLLRGEVQLPLRRDLLVVKSKRAKAKQAPAAVAEQDQALWEALRERRKRLATDNNIPPYVVFHDSTLMQMAAEKPQTAEALLGISGIGQTKLDRYGDAFLEVIREAS
jgi:ATP-dependent DNA helicase RecQ